LKGKRVLAMTYRLRFKIKHLASHCCLTRKVESLLGFLLFPAESHKIERNNGREQWWTWYHLDDGSEPSFHRSTTLDMFGFLWELNSWKSRWKSRFTTGLVVFHAWQVVYRAKKQRKTRMAWKRCNSSCTFKMCKAFERPAWRETNFLDPSTESALCDWSCR
jgi:hypothetical protein